MADDKEIVNAYFAPTELTVNDLESTAWNNTQPVKIADYWSGERAPDRLHAEARILWTKTALLVRYVCNRTEPLVISDNPQTQKKTMGLWDRDVCEIFIAPDPRVVERYFEFEVAPTGEWLDAAIDLTSGKRETDWQFNSQMAAAAKIESDRLTIAMRIPWSRSIPQPQRSDRWRINLFRCVGKDPNRGYLAWQPTRTPEPLFHVPKVFGWLAFG